MCESKCLKLESRKHSFDSVMILTLVEVISSLRDLLVAETPPRRLLAFEIGRALVNLSKIFRRRSKERRQ